MKKFSSLFDPVQKQLLPFIWDGYTMRPGISETIIAHLKTFFPMNKVESVVLIGSSTTYQYNDESDIDVQVTGVEGESVEKWKEVFRPHNQGNYYFPGTRHPLNFFFREHIGRHYGAAYENAQGAYDLQQHVWLKKPIPPNVIKDPTVKYDTLIQYSNIYADSIGYYVRALARAFRDIKSYPKDSERYHELQDQIKKYTAELLYKYQELDQAKKLTYRYGIGTPSYQENTIIYKYITHGPYGHLLKVLGKDEQ